MTDQGELFGPAAAAGRRRRGRIRRGLDAATTAELREESPALLALARVTADLLDGAAARHLAYTDADADAPYGLTVALPKLIERYAGVLELLERPGEVTDPDADAFAALMAELTADVSAQSGDASTP
jgi:hypothetical protein